MLEIISFSPSVETNHNELNEAHKLLCAARGTSPRLDFDEIMSDFERYSLFTQGSVTKPPGYCLYRDDDGEITGLSHQTYFSSSNILKLDAIAVEPERRGRGVGSEILESILTFAPEHATNAELDVRKSNLATIALYASYEFVSKCESPDEESSSYLTMELAL